MGSGQDHIGFRVESVDNTIDELKRRNVTIISEPHDEVAMNNPVAFFADPWGNLFEFIQPLSD
jgi:catechol 2,3-dioxygenase-like lactoylglutathione lyase family enzyme